MKRLSRFAEVSLQMTSKARIGSPCYFGLQAGLAEGSWLRVGGVGPHFHCSGPGWFLRYPAGHRQPHQPFPLLSLSHLSEGQPPSSRCDQPRHPSLTRLLLMPHIQEADSVLDFQNISRTLPLLPQALATHA